MEGGEMSEAKRFDDLLSDTEEFLTDLSTDDVHPIKAGLRSSRRSSVLGR